MGVVTKKIKISTKGETDIIDITPMLEGALGKTKLANGTVTAFVPGATAGITTIECESGLIEDIKKAFEKLAPRNGEYAHNMKWSDGNGFSHIRASLLGPGITVPFSNKKLCLGTWQQVILIDFDNRPRSREVVLQFIGE
jgi:secondary thiamine-phosphate synthase enzyme